MDTNILHYSIQDLMTILNITTLNSEEIIDKTNHFMEEFDEKGKQTMSLFFSNMQKRLLNYIENPNDDIDNQQMNQWYTNDYLQQEINESNDLSTSFPFPYSQQQGQQQQGQQQQGQQQGQQKQQQSDSLQKNVANEYNVPVAQDDLNPTLENVTSRFINLDSQYRQSTKDIESSSCDYVLNLSEPIHKVLSLRLYSVQIPYTWYVIDETQGTTCFWIENTLDDNTIELITISIASGNYTPDELVTIINKDTINGFSQPDFTFTETITANYPLSYNPNNGKITLHLEKGSWKHTAFSSITTNIIFYDQSGGLRCSTNSCTSSTPSKSNQTLGYLMGFRQNSMMMNENGNTAESLIDLYGPKYLLFSLNDYIHNRINNGLITITELSKNVKLPTYYNKSLKSKTCIMDSTFKIYPQIQPTEPRTLTQAQIYAINSIVQTNEKNTNTRGTPPSSSDTFALIPLKHSNSNQTGDVYVEFGGALQDNKRIYFGPVTIERLHVKLYDDKGNILNMNGTDWSITLIADILYQY